MTDRLATLKIPCRGGLYTNEDFLTLSDNLPGAATRLVNFEVSPFGGYRRISGYKYIDATYNRPAGTGAILGLFIYNDVIYAARKKSSGTDYDVLKYVSGAGWSSVSLTAGQSATNVVRIRGLNHSVTGNKSLILTDGINYPMRLVDTSWTKLNGSTDVDNASFAEAFKNRIFFAGMSQSPQLLVFTAPNSDSNFTAASGAGSVNVGFDITGIKRFRDNLYIFGKNDIRRLSGDSINSFVIQEVSNSVGCVASDSIQEIGGDVIFLAPDGIRTVQGTERIGDVELATISKPIQQVLNLYDINFTNEQLCSTVVREKSQFRYMFGKATLTAVNTSGFLGGLRTSDQRTGWEFSELRGIQANCAVSGFVGDDEYVLHGDHSGYVYRQEQGGTFQDDNVYATYVSPFLDFGNTEKRKVFSQVTVFTRPEGDNNFIVTADYDWLDSDYASPNDYTIASTGGYAEYRDTETAYNTAGFVYGGATKPVIRQAIQGSGHAIQFKFVTVSSANPYTIHGFAVQFGEAGVR
tara:strand:+ start:5436 stop:7001 length:1566 start_codon:yes stop_codon:yes gene_type:complete